MTSVYNLNDLTQKSFEVFQEMKKQRIIPDETSSVTRLNACAQMNIHSRCQSIVDQIPLHLQNDQMYEVQLLISG